MTEPSDLIGMKCPWSFNQWSDWHNRMLSLCPYKNCPYLDSKYNGIICLAYDGYRKSGGEL
jgi:hypothetical protein